MMARLTRIIRFPLSYYNTTTNNNNNNSETAVEKINYVFSLNIFHIYTCTTDIMNYVIKYTIYILVVRMFRTRLKISS